MEIPIKFLKMCCMKSLEESIKYYGDNEETYFTFYDTFLTQSDKRVLQYLRECALNIESSLQYEEYLELEKIRQYCVDELRKIRSITN